MRARERLTFIEAGRGLAAIAVVFYHAARHLDKIHPAPALTTAFRFGHAGVDFFFVISGFIILHVHAADIGRPARLRHYAERRLTRVLPAYWVALALTILLVIAGPYHTVPSLGRLITSALLLPSHTAPLLGIAWTLQYEMVFYFVFGVLILNRAAGAALGLFWLACIAAGTIMPNPGAFPASLYGAYNLEFFAGMATAYLLATHRITAPALLLATGVCGFAIAAVAEDAGWLDGYSNVARLAYGLPCTMIVLGAAACDLAQRTSVPALLRVLGTASYSVYLFQFVFIGVGWLALSAVGLAGLPAWVNFALLASFAVAGGVMMSQRVEYPLMRVLRRRPENATSRVGSNTNRP